MRLNYGVQALALVLLAAACSTVACGDSGGAGGNGGEGGGGLQPRCGDKITDPDLGEECDDGNLADEDDCLSTCKKAKCGDSVLRESEECDDGNSIDTDACPSTCFAATCGDSYVWAGMEECDDGNEEDGDACSSSCTAGAGCGNGTQEGGEECDDGNTSNADECTNACKNAVCGDGFARNGVEECDDGNMVNNDTCANDCSINPLQTYQCPGTPVAVALNMNQTVGADLTASVDTYRGSCGVQGNQSGPDAVFAVTTAADGVLFLELTGDNPMMDPVLYVRANDCAAGTELICSDFTLVGGVETATIAATGGTTYYVFVDSFNGDNTGNVALSAYLLSQVPGDDCPGITIPIANFNVPVSFSGNTLPASADRTGLGACNSPGTKDVVLKVRPDLNGKLFAALAPQYDGSIYVRSVCNDASTQLACEEKNGPGAAEVLTIDVSAGVEYFVIIDGWDGDAGPFAVEFTLIP